MHIDVRMPIVVGQFVEGWIARARQRGSIGLPLAGRFYDSFQEFPRSSRMLFGLWSAFAHRAIIGGVAVQFAGLSKQKSYFAPGYLFQRTMIARVLATLHTPKAAIDFQDTRLCPMQ